MYVKVAKDEVAANKVVAQYNGEDTIYEDYDTSSQS
jgi:hypothetical protein